MALDTTINTPGILVLEECKGRWAWGCLDVNHADATKLQGWANDKILSNSWSPDGPIVQSQFGWGDRLLSTAMDQRWPHLAKQVLEVTLANILWQVANENGPARDNLQDLKIRS